MDLKLVLLITLLPLVIRSQEEYCGGKPADVVFLLDASNSIWGPDFKKQLTFVQSIVNTFNIGPNYTRVGLATFNRRTDIHFYLDSYSDKQELVDAIGNVTETYGDATNTALAIRTMRRELFSSRRGSRGNVPKVGVIITDGQSSNILRTVFEAAKSKRQEIHIFAIGVGDAVNSRELRGIASKPPLEYMFQVLGYGALGSVMDKLAVRTCTVSKRPPRPTPPTFVRRRTTTTTTPRPTKKPEPTMVISACEDKSADVVFAIDTSNKITANDYWRQIRFVREVARRMDIASNKTRVGLVAYADQVLRQFDLNDHTKMKTLLEAILRSQRSGGGTRIDNAIRYVRTKSFRRSIARNKTSQIGIFIAGSQSRNIQNTKKEAIEARKSGITLFSIGVGPGFDKNEMSVIGKDDQGYMIDSFDELDTLIKDLTLKACRVRPSERPVSDQPCGFRQQADLMFILDSVNAGRSNTKKSLEFVKSVSRAVDIDKENVQVGLMSAECDPGNEGFSLGTHRDQKSLMNALNEKRGTDITKLLKNMRRKSFSSKEGGRRDAKKVAVVVVDGNLEQPLKALREARFARIRGVEVYVVAVGNEKRQKEMEMMCDAPVQQHFFRVNNYDELKELKGDLVNMLCDEL